MTVTKEAAREKELREKLEKIIESGDEETIQIVGRFLDLILS